MLAAAAANVFVLKVEFNCMACCKCLRVGVCAGVGVYVCLYICASTCDALCY